MNWMLATADSTSNPKVRSPCLTKSGNPLQIALKDL